MEELKEAAFGGFAGLCGGYVVRKAGLLTLENLLKIQMSFIMFDF